jgi:oligopeptide transport system permease protein
MAAVRASGRAAASPQLIRKPENLWASALRRLVRNRAAVIGMVIIAILFLTYIFADRIAIKPYDVQINADNNAVPEWLVELFPMTRGYARVNNAYPLGADSLGRDLFSRLVYGTRVSLTVALVGPLIALLIGIAYGSISGFFGGRVDNIMMRLVDVMYAFPGILFIILLMAFFRSTFGGQQAAPGTLRAFLSALDAKVGGMLFIFIGIGMTAWEGMARLTRGQILSLREKEFVEAARSIGASNWRIMFRHLLPNAIGPLIVAETLNIPGYINTETFLSFIGLGVMAPTPSWGAMIAQGALSVRTYPHQVLFPGLALSITMFAFNFLGDGLRDALDPRMRGTS